MKKTALCLLLTLTCLIFAGCWDIHDISTRAIVTGIGIDKAEATGSSLYNFTFEIIKPGNLQEPTFETANIVETVQAVNLGQAIEQLQVKISRLIFLGHLRVVLLGEEAGQTDFRDIADMIIRDPHIATRVRLMCVQNGLAQDVLQAKPLLNKYVAADLVAMTQLQKELALARDIPFYEILNEMLSTNGKALTPRVITAEEKGSIVRDGGAVFNGWKLTGWLSSEEIKAANWLVGKADTTILGSMGEGKYTYRTDAKKLSIKPLNGNGRLQISVTLKTKGSIISKQQSELDLTRPENIKKLEDLLSGVVTKQVESAVKKSQDMGVDYLGIGNAIKRKDPRLFKSIKWDEAYPAIPVVIQVKCEIDEFGVLK